MLLTDEHRNAVLIEQAREDAQAMHRQSKIESFRAHARKVSARFSNDSHKVIEDEPVSHTR